MGYVPVLSVNKPKAMKAKTPMMPKIKPNNLINPAKSMVTKALRFGKKSM